MTEPKKIASPEGGAPTWQKVVAGIYAAVVIVAVVVFRSHLHEDFIPLDDSRLSPNILASAIIVVCVTPVGVLLWPPTRRRIHQFMDRKLDRLHDRFDGLQGRVEELHRKHDDAASAHSAAMADLAAEVARLHERLDKR